MGCLKLTYKRNNDTLKVAYSLYRENQKYCTGSYRYGFNGKENDKETISTGDGTQDYGFRIYNPSLGRFLSVDPLTKDYSGWSPYPFSMNRPVDGIDLDGLEWSRSTNLTSGKDVYTVKIKVINSSKTMTETQVKTASANIAKYAQKTYSGKIGGNEVEMKVELEFVGADKIDKKKDFYMDFVDKIEGGSANAVGKVNKIGTTQSNRIQILSSGMTDEQTAETGAHELGHTGGLRHETDPGNPSTVLNSMEGNNIMNAANFGNTKSSPEQIKELNKNIPLEKQTVKFDTHQAQQDKTRVEKPIVKTK